MRSILAVYPSREYHSPIEKPETLKPLFAISLSNTATDRDNSAVSIRS